MITFEITAIRREEVINDMSKTVIMGSLDWIEDMNWDKLLSGEFFIGSFMKQPYRTTRNLSSLHLPITQ